MLHLLLLFFIIIKQLVTAYTVTSLCSDELKERWFKFFISICKQSSLFHFKTWYTFTFMLRN